MKALIITALCLYASCLLSVSSGEEIELVATDIKQFFFLSKEASVEREKRLVSIEKFNEMSKKKNTIIIDSRSKNAFEDVHIKGAIHLNFSDFTAEKLESVIPDKETTILIYCNNNFISEQIALTAKMAPLALNIPTFINLYGYGYKNVYELEDRIPDSDERVQLEGRSMIKVDSSN